MKNETEFMMEMYSSLTHSITHSLTSALTHSSPHSLTSSMGGSLTHSFKTLYESIDHILVFFEAVTVTSSITKIFVMNGGEDILVNFTFISAIFDNEEHIPAVQSFTRSLTLLYPELESSGKHGKVNARMIELFGELQQFQQLQCIVGSFMDQYELI